MDDPAKWSSAKQNPYAPPQPEFTSEVAVPTGQVDKAQLLGTRRGLQLTYFGIVTILVAVVVMILGVVVFNAMRGGLDAGRGPSIGLGVLVGTAALAIFVGSIMMFVGKCFCLTVPPASRARGLVATSVILQVAGIFVSVMGAIFRVLSAPLLTPSAEAISGLAQLSSGVMGVVSFFLFLVFIKRVAVLIKRHDLSDRAGNVILVFGSLIGLYLLTLVAVVVMSASGGLGDAVFPLVLAGGVGCLVFILALVGLAMYTTLLRNMIAALDDPNSVIPKDRSFKI